MSQTIFDSSYIRKSYSLITANKEHEEIALRVAKKKRGMSNRSHLCLDNEFIRTARVFEK